MRNTLIFLILILTSNSSYAGFPPFTDVSPNNITVGNEVLIGYDPLQSPCLQALPNFQGLTEYIEIDGDNFIDITIVALGVSPCLNIGVENPPYQYYSLGELPEGDYTVQMYWTDNSVSLPVTDPSLRIAIGDLLHFSVLAPVSVPTLGDFGLIILGFAFFIIALFKFKKSTQLLSVMLLVCSFSLHSKTFHIMLSGDASAPSVDAVINQASTSPSPPAWLLSSFNQENPTNVEYLIKERPTGNRLNIVNSAPDWALSKLYRYLVVTYPDSVDKQTILTNFQNDVHVEVAALVDATTITVSSLPALNKGQNKYEVISRKQQKGAGSNFLTDLNIISAWELSEGMGYIGALDLGIQVDHPDLRAFDGSGNYLGGNMLDGLYQIDFGDNDLNIDEQQPFDTQGIPSLEACDLQDGVNDNMATSIFVGHGTHITGIMAGGNNSVGGVCKNCGMAMMKNSTYRANNQSFCINYNGVNTLFPLVPFDASINGMTVHTNFGVGVVNWSGGAKAINEFYCDTDDSGLCIAMDYMLQQNTLLVGAAGNHRRKMQFPASEVGTVAVGGLDESGGFWNESPSNGDPFDFSDNSNCPRTDPLNECGSNYSHNPTNQKLDVMTQARTVFSTFYENGEWADDINCTDFQDGSVDGYGNCTGTSMSAPQVAGILQLMRSAHPLLPNGTSDPSLTTGLINVLNATASRSISGLGVSDFLGYGLPDARLALEKILGKSNAVQLKTRLTPMFALSSAGDKNDIYSAFPQVAMAFLLYNGALYIPDTNAPLVNEFTDFWYDTANLNFPKPRAAFYVFTTNNNPFTGTKNMVPLRRMEKIVGGNRNDTYAVSTSEIESFHADNYNYAGIEGYILPTCSPTPACVPNGATALYRDEADNLNHKLIATNTAPPSSTLLGYVYLNQDTDGDGLIDGQEIILGTNINLIDSDGDTVPDGVEYPPAGVPYSDPMTNDIIFKDGFEGNTKTKTSEHSSEVIK